MEDGKNMYEQTKMSMFKKFSLGWLGVGVFFGTEKNQKYERCKIISARLFMRASHKFDRFGFMLRFASFFDRFWWHGSFGAVQSIVQLLADVELLILCRLPPFFVVMSLVICQPETFFSVLNLLISAYTDFDCECALNYISGYISFSLSFVIVIRYNDFFSLLACSGADVNKPTKHEPIY